MTLNKSKLYESIMRDVSKVIKRHLNEGVNNPILTQDQIDEIRDIQVNEVIQPAVDDSGYGCTEWVYDDFIFDIDPKTEDVYLPYLGQDAYDDFTSDNFGDAFDNLNKAIQTEIACAANEATEEYFEGNTSASYEDYE